MTTRVHRVKITPSAIPVGLMTLDRKSLSIFLAIFEDSSAISLITDQLGNLRDKIYSGSVQWVTGEQNVTQERFTKRIIETASKIEGGSTPDNALRLALWAHIRDAFDLEASIAVSPRDLDYVANDIGSAISASAAQKKRAEAIADLSLKTPEYWKRLVKDANPFTSNQEISVTFEEAVREAVSTLFGNMLISDETAETEKQELLSIIKELSSLDQKILEEANLETLSDEAIQKVLISGGGLLGLMGAVEAAGFGAYIFAAQASAIIPLVGGKTLVSALFVLSHPLFVLPVLFATGASTAKGLAQAVRRAFAVSVSSLLTLRGLDSGALSRADTVRMFQAAPNLINKVERANSPISIPSSGDYRELAVHLGAHVSLPADDDETRSLIFSLDRPLGPRGNEQLIESFLFPNTTTRKEAVILASLTLFDFLYDVSAINPKVLEAADFSHTADLGDPFVFAEFAEKVVSLSDAAIRGHEANLLGYTAERVVAERLVESGYVVSIPESASQPGYDLLVDGIQFQVKCIDPINFQILERHFEKYPDTPVIVNFEVTDMIIERAPDWLDKVFFVEGYTYEFTDGLVEAALKAGTEIGDYELVPMIATMSVIKNANGWWIGQQSLKEASFNVAVESATKGAMSVAGGFVGKGIGALMFGPAGAYVFGGVLAVAATMESHWLSDHVDTVLDPTRDKELDQAAAILLKSCIGHLEAKILGVESKINSLPKNKISDAMRYRWAWELAFIQSKINEANFLLKGRRQSGERLTIAALEFSTRCGVHPFWLQEDYKGLLTILQRPKDRWEKALGIASSTFKSLRDKIKKENKT